MLSVTLRVKPSFVTQAESLFACKQMFGPDDVATTQEYMPAVDRKVRTTLPIPACSQSQLSSKLLHNQNIFSAVKHTAGPNPRCGHTRLSAAIGSHT